MINKLEGNNFKSGEIFSEKIPLLINAGRFLIKTINTKEELSQAFLLRYQVFQVEMIGLPANPIEDSDESLLLWCRFPDQRYTDSTAVDEGLFDGAWDGFPHVKRLHDEIGARPAAARALALKDKHKFKTEMDQEALHAMFPHLKERVA